MTLLHLETDGRKTALEVAGHCPELITPDVLGICHAVTITPVHGLLLLRC